MKRYERNRIYISDKDQVKIKDFRILLAGAGIGSNIAETLLRIGFETITLVDGDVVEESNLNRQNYTEEDLGQPKVEALKKRLLSINPNAKISAINTFINHDNVRLLHNQAYFGSSIFSVIFDYSFLIMTFFDLCIRLLFSPISIDFAIEIGAFLLI